MWRGRLCCDFGWWCSFSFHTEVVLSLKVSLVKRTLNSLFGWRLDKDRITGFGSAVVTTKA